MNILIICSGKGLPSGFRRKEYSEAEASDLEYGKEEKSIGYAQPFIRSGNANTPRIAPTLDAAVDIPMAVPLILVGNISAG